MNRPGQHDVLDVAAHRAIAGFRGKYGGVNKAIQSAAIVSPWISRQLFDQLFEHNLDRCIEVPGDAWAE